MTNYGRPPGMKKKLTSGELLVGRMLAMERIQGLYKYIPGQAEVKEIPVPPEMQEFNYDKQASVTFVSEDERMAVLCTMGRYRDDHQWYVLGIQKAGTNYIGPVLVIPKGGGPESEWQIDDGAHEKLMALNECQSGCTSLVLKGDCYDLAHRLFEELGTGIHDPKDLSSEHAYIARELNVRHPGMDWSLVYMKTKEGYL